MNAKHNRLFSLVLALLTLCIVISSAGGRDWPMFRKDISNHGLTKDDGAEENFEEWTYTIEPDTWTEGEPVIWASPVIADSSVYVATRHGYVYCFGLCSGSLLWHEQVSDTISSTPTISDGYLYVVGGKADRKVHCLDASDGDSIWASMPLGASASDWCYEDYTSYRPWVESSPLVVGDSAVYVGARNGYLYRLDASDGDTLWTRQLGEAIWSSPAYADDKLFIGSYGTVNETFGSDSSGVYCVDEDDGTILWHYHYKNGSPHGTMGSPLVFEDKVYVGINRYIKVDVGGGAMACFDTMSSGGRSIPPPDPETPHDPSWTTNVECDVRGTPVILKSKAPYESWLYFSSGKGLYAVDIDDSGDYRLGTSATHGIKPGGGDEFWSSPSVSAHSTPTEVETLLYVGVGGGTGGIGAGAKFWALDTSLDSVWCADSVGNSWASPAISNGKVVTCSNGGKVYCFMDNPSGQGRVAPPMDAVDGVGDDQKRLLTMGVPADQAAGSRPSFAANHPDPFANDTVIHFALEGNDVQLVDLKIYDVNGRLVRNLLSKEAILGQHSVQWDGTSDDGHRVGPGIYYYQISNGDKEISKQMLLMK